MAKQTLFEAEAILTANTAGMLRDIEDAVTKAQARLNSLNGSINIFGSGGGGGRGGGSSQNPNNNNNSLYRLNMELAKQQTIQGNLARAAQMYGNIMTSTLFTSEQITRAETARLRVLNQIARAQNAAANPAGVQGPPMANGSFVSPYGGLSNPKGFVGPLMANGQKVFNTGRGGGQGPSAGSGLQTAMFANASYGIQDLITVLSMGGGLQRALLSASNNLAFMASMTGTLTGALAGVGLVIGATVLPSLIKYTTGIKDASDFTEEHKQKIEDLKKSLEDLRNAYDMVEKARQSKDKPFKEVEAEYRNKQAEAAKERATIAGAQKNSREAGIFAATRLVNSFGDINSGQAGLAPSAEIAEFQTAMRGVINGTVSSGELRAKAGEATNTDQWRFGLKDKYIAVAEAMETAGKDATDAAERLGNLNREMAILGKEAGAETFLKKVLKDTIEGTGMLGYTQPDIIGDFIRSMGGGSTPKTWKEQKAEAEAEKAKRDRNARQQEMHALGISLPAMQSVYSRLFPKESEIEAIRKEYKDSGLDKTSSGKAMMEYEISQLNNKRDKISGTMGAGDFANQLTNSLLKNDPLSKIAEYAKTQVGLQESMKEDIRKSAERLEQLTTSPFTD